MALDSLITSNCDLVASCPESVARSNGCVPLRILGKTLVMGYCGEQDPTTEGKLRFILNRPIRMIQRCADWIAARTKELYGDDQNYPPQSDEDCSVTWYWPGWFWFEPGTLNIKCSGWTETGHWSGCHPVRYDDPDIEFWIWIVKQKYYHRLVEHGEIPKIKRIWRRYKQRC